MTASKTLKISPSNTNKNAAFTIRKTGGHSQSVHSDLSLRTKLDTEPHKQSLHIIYKHSFACLSQPGELQWEISTNCFHSNV